ncbi:MAG TPA: DUF92 domain-containing protein [archaeon]|nr:DUF92 domain-containing protein [archaeon]
MNPIFYFLFFYALGIVLWITKKYDIFTISLIFGMTGLFLYFGKTALFIYLLMYFSVAEGLALILKNKGENRSYINLLGNCLVGTVLVVFGQIYSAASTICGAFADTMSSEIGRLSKSKPRLITNLKRKVEPGTNGGITFLGLFAALMVSTITFVFFYFVFKVNIKTSLIIASFGIIGSLIDSFIGAAIENKGYLDNSQTNFLTTFIVGALSIIALIYI